LPLTDLLTVRCAAVGVVAAVVVGSVAVGDVVVVGVRAPGPVGEVGPAGAAVRSSP
jgi:hypothetical protein